jgi:hypothetical protein
MKRISVAVLVYALGAAAFAATSPSSSSNKVSGAKPPREGGRFLFVVDTSSSMKSIDPATRQTLFDLLFSGIDGYMRTGDTFGIWTFDDEVGTGKFPMEVWDAEKPMPIASRAARFMRDQEYKGGNRMEELIQKLTAVIRAVSNVNVFLITDGEVRMQGLPMDNEINAAYAQRAKERRAARKPFITTIVVEGGKFIRGAVTLPGEPILLRRRPATTVATAKTAAPGNTNGTPAPVATRPPVKSAPEKAAGAPDISTPGKPLSAINSETANSPKEANAPDVSASASLVSVTNTALVDTNETREAASLSPAFKFDNAATNDSPASQSSVPRRKVMQIITNRISSPSTKSGLAEEKLTDSQTDSQPQVLIGAQVSNLAPTIIRTNLATATTAAPTALPASGPAAPTPELSTPLTRAPASDSTDTKASGVRSASQPLVVAARELRPPTAISGETKPASLAALQSQPALGAIPTLVLGGLLLALSLFLLAIALRRMRPQPQGSLITQSMHRR